jgi:multimeric flavodoxin WrbA
MDIKPCSACGACQKRKRGDCVIKDDMRRFYPRLKACDALVMASPIYWMTVSAQTKLFLDRWYPLAAEGAPGIGAKRAVVCLTYGAPDILQSGCDNAARMLNDCFTFLKIPVQFVHASAWRKGGIKTNRAVLRKAYQVGREAVT